MGPSDEKEKLGGIISKEGEEGKKEEEECSGDK